jgi:site-specific DNA-methyltransferase (adenine-specific)
MSYAPGKVRDGILGFFSGAHVEGSLSEIVAAVVASIGPVPESSIRSYLNLNTPKIFVRTSRGHYKLASSLMKQVEPSTTVKDHKIGKATLYQADCLAWLGNQEPASIHAVITDPPYGLREYSSEEQTKLRRGKGGMWRIPPSYDGHQRAPLPRFTVLDPTDKNRLEVFFKTFGSLLHRALVPGANVAIASNPLLAHIVSTAMSAAGFEIRGSIVRLTMTMRGGDRPKKCSS